MVIISNAPNHLNAPNHTVLYWRNVRNAKSKKHADQKLAATMMPTNKDIDARAVVPGFDPYTNVQTTRKKRAKLENDSTKRVLNFDYAGADNPLTLSEQKAKTRAHLTSNPASMVFFPHTKEERDKCVKITLNNVLQFALSCDDDLIAVANHRLSLLANDPNKKVRDDIAALMDGGYQFYDALEGRYDDHCLSWWSEEFFYKGCLVKLDMADREAFVNHYKKYSNGAKARH